jgi:glycosyltransferase involved in cell wall biosynthesis
MNIAHLSTSITLNQTVYNQMVYQRSKGHRVVALCPDDDWTKPLKERDIEVIDVPYIWHDAKASMTTAFLKTIQVCRREKFDVVHTHTLLPGLAGRIGARLGGIPCVVHTFHSWPPHLFKNIYFRWGFYASEVIAAHFAHANMFQNPDDLQSWRKIPGVPHKTATLVGNGIDFSTINKKAALGDRQKVREEFGATEDDYVIINVARFEPQKGHSFLLQSLHNLKSQANRKFIVVLVGDGRDQGKVEAEVKSLGLQDMVCFAGYRADVPQLLAASDVSVMTSHYEGIPRALMESMALGLPVVATNVPGTRSLIRAGKTGLLVEYGDAIGFSGALVKLMTDPALATRMGKSGKDLVETEFNEYVVAERVEEIYNHILNNRPDALPRWTLDVG